MAKKKKQTKQIVTCHYCEIFKNSKDRRKEVINNRTHYKRYCKFVGKMVHSKIKICEDFIPVKIFWCDKRGYWMDIETCLHLACKGCKQLRIIKEVEEWTD